VRSRSFSVSLALIFGYYLLLTAGEAMAERGTLPAVIALWIPNVVYALVGVSLFVTVARERSLDMGFLTRRLPGFRTGGVGASP
jgi:lipopolysaccharide export system permease protein